jgi:hypothetical protein
MNHGYKTGPSHGHSPKRSKNAKHGAKESDGRGGRGDCGKSAKAESQCCRKSLATALEGAFGVADKSTGLLAGFAVVIEELADDGNRVNQHQ